MEMLEIIHNNCRRIKENKRLQEQQKIIKEQQREKYNKRMCILLSVTLVIGLIAQIIIVNL